MTRLAVVGTAGWPQDLAQYIGANIADLNQGDGITIVHADRPTPFEKLLTRWCNGEGWSEVKVKDVTKYISQVDALIFFNHVGHSRALKEWVDDQEAQGVMVYEITA